MPYRHHRIVRWGECDPEGVIYTPRAFDYLMEAIESWHEEILGVRWIDLKHKRNMGSPTVRTECEFLDVLRAGMEVDVVVRVAKLGNASVTFNIEVVDASGHHYLRFSHVSCYITLDGFKSMTAPDDFRERIEAYQRACGDA